MEQWWWVKCSLCRSYPRTFPHSPFPTSLTRTHVSSACAFLEGVLLLSPFAIKVWVVTLRRILLLSPVPPPVLLVPPLAGS